MALPSGDKPLPILPAKDSGVPTSKLTVESRAHLKEFIRYALAEEKVDGSAEWAKGIELALNELVHSVSRGAWLPGFRRARRIDMLRRNEKDKQRKRLEKERREKEEESKDAKKTKSRINEDKSPEQADRPNDGAPQRKETIKSNDERRRAALQQLHLALASPIPPSPKITPRHLLLTLSPKGAVLPSRDMDFDIIPSNKFCVFTADKYTLPSLEEWDRGTGGLVLFGLDEWAADMQERIPGDRPKLVGGTFTFTGISSSAQLQSLCNVLRLSVFMLLSLLLEQSLLANSHVDLHYPPAIAAQPLLFSLTSPDVPARRPKSKSLKSSAASGIWSFLTKRTEGFLGRSSNTVHVANANNAYTRTKSLDPYSISSANAPSPPPTTPPRTFRRLSLSLPHGPLRLGDANKSKQNDDATFATILTRVNSAAPLLSTSVGVVFTPPRVLSILADKEGKDPGRKLLGDERVSLSSLLGWEGRENGGKGMVGLLGFVKHQGITLLYAEYVPSKTVLVENQDQTGKLSAVSTSTSTRSDNQESESKSNSQAASSSAVADVRDNPSTLIPCDRGRLVSYRYYVWSCSQLQNSRSSQSIQGDRTLGDMIESLCAVEDDSERKCEKTGCCAEKCEHRRMWIHGGLRITAEVCKGDEKEEEEWAPSGSNLGDAIHMWASCAVCKKETERKKMSEGAYLYSFAKYLELLIYSPSLCTLNPELCEHTSPGRPPFPVNDTSPPSRFNIIRHFRHGPRSTRFTLSASPAVFEVRMPRLQIVKGRNAVADAAVAGIKKTKAQSKMEGEGTNLEGKGSLSGVEEEKRALRKEIKNWWQGVAEHLDRLDECFIDGELRSYHKSLPRLPTDVDPYASDDDMSQSVTQLSSLPALPPSRSSSSTSSCLTENDGERTIKGATTPATRTRSRSRSRSRESSSSILSIPAHQLLVNLRHSFQQTEQTLYAQLSKTPTSNLNDVRRNFSTVSKSARLRLDAWEKKHVKGRVDVPVGQAGKLETPEPEWWKPGCHAVPGGKVVVRESEWGSVIAFTLSSVDYVQELASISTTKSDSSTGESVTRTNSLTSTSEAQTPHPSVTSTSSATTSSSAKTSNLTNLDPDIDTVWCEPEAHSAIIARQDNPRDPSGLLSLRDVLRNRRTTENGQSSFLPSSKFSPSKFIPLKPSSGPAVSSTRAVRLCTPPSAWAEPAVEVSMQAAGGMVSGLPEAAESAEKLLHVMESVAESGAGSSFFTGPWKANSSSEAETTLDVGKDPTRRPPSVISVESDIIAINTDTNAAQGSAEGTLIESATTALNLDGPDSSQQALASIITSKQPPPPPHKDAAYRNIRQTNEPSERKYVHAQSTSSITNPSVTSSLASTVTNAMRYLLNGNEQMRPMSPSHHHKLLALKSLPIEDRPHIRYEWTVGKRLRFTCTVYYARQFDLLRRRCGVEDILPKSLERSEMWAAEGGKSRSNFWKTSDDGFVIKTLVDAWNVADLQVLLDIAPSYFRYMDTTASRPSVLAKLLGFYTVEIKNLEAGTTQAKADLLVMENLFYDQNVSKTFDLKGIQGRKVKSSGGAATAEATGKGDGKDGVGKRAESVKTKKKTLFDGDWIEDQRKALILLQPHSKLVLNEAVKADADFLCKCNIMDYSLLLGVDEEKRQIACGLVDTIGSYTFAKTLEYKAKQNLQSGKETTVIPPNEYHARFVGAINNYFLACPDKWTKQAHDLQTNDHDLTLPSVL